MNCCNRRNDSCNRFPCCVFRHLNRVKTAYFIFFVLSILCIFCLLNEKTAYVVLFYL